MAKQPDDPKEFEPSQKSKYEPVLEPIEKIQQNYPPSIKTNYPKLIRKDLHLAEIYRVASKDSPVPFLEKYLNPLQTKVDGKGRVWVDVLMERKKGVTLKELRTIMRVHGTPGRSRFISGRVQVDKLPRLDDKAARLQTARPVISSMNNSVKTISANQTKLANEGFGNLKGTGVIIGFVDVGCDFNHPNFKKNSKTRLLYLWDQNGKKGLGKRRPDHYNYGIEYNDEEINQAIAAGSTESADPFSRLGYQIAPACHGVPVMDIAAGNSTDLDFRGIAPDADLIFVDLGMPTTKKKIAREETKTMGSSKYLYDAVNYIFEKADIEGKPVVVNISLGANGGSHDGSSLLESRFDELLMQPGRAIVIGAGNDFLEKSHKSGQITSGQGAEISWVIPKANNPNWRFRQEMELWYPGDKSLKVEVFAPVRNEQGEISSSLLGSCGLGETKSEGSDTVPIWIIRNHQAEPEIDKDENYIHFLVDNRVDDFVGGERLLKVSLEGPNSGNDVPVKFHAWIERNLGRPQTEFADNTDEDRSFTINGIGNARLPLVVGAFSPSTSPARYSPTYLSSSGPSLNPLAEHKPELSAPGENISCAQALVADRADMTGTSAAAPHVTGVIALMFQQALNLPQPRLLHMQEIRDILIATADRNATRDMNRYHPQLGYGRVNAVKALKRIVPR